MIKVGIVGASTRMAGELIRILVNHPEVVLKCAYEPEKTGHTVSSVHHGLIGECDIKFTEQIDLQKLDCLLLCAPSAIGEQVLEHESDYPELRVVDMTGEHRADADACGLVYGLSEINRKPLVRGAKRALLPSPGASAALIALYPFANLLMLLGDIDIKIQGVNAGATDAEEIERVLKTVQKSFVSRANVEHDESSEPNRRGLRVSIEFDSTLSLHDALEVYEDIYDDHNFTFVSSEPLETKEVEGTNKCLVSVSKPSEGRIHLEVIVDGTMRGGAGEGVHLLNLLFGLHEKTGLALKSSVY